MQVADRVIEIIKETEKQTPKLRAIVQHNKEEVLKVIKLMHCTFVVTRCCPADLPHLQCNLWCFCNKEVVLPVRVGGWPTSQPPAWAHWSLLFDLATIVQSKLKLTQVIIKSVKFDFTFTHCSLANSVNIF